ncbi:MAG: CapA family protein, partial [Clostridia bacterium]|nr:CapA family protein [Clostridia bacterium]
HLLHGCEIYKGRAIYHGLNNFVMWVPSLSPNYKGKRDKDMDSSNNEEWVKKRVERFGFVPDPDYPTYPFHPDSIYTAAAKCIIEGGKITDTLLVPILVGKDGVSRVVGPENGGQAVFDYLVSITEQAGLNARYEWAGEDIRIVENKLAH